MTTPAQYIHPRSNWLFQRRGNGGVLIQAPTNDLALDGSDGPVECRLTAGEFTSMLRALGLFAND